jgi:Arginine deiminase
LGADCYQLCVGRPAVTGKQRKNAPGAILGCERDVATKPMLRQPGIEVIAVPGEELDSGGSRWMTCPTEGDATSPGHMAAEREEGA